MSDLKEEKKALRAVYKEKRRLIAKEDKCELDERLCLTITELDLFKSADVLLLFYPSSSEPNITAVAIEALRQNKKIAFPLPWGLGSNCPVARNKEAI